LEGEVVSHACMGSLGVGRVCMGTLEGAPVMRAERVRSVRFLEAAAAEGPFECRLCRSAGLIGRLAACMTGGVV